MWMWKEKMEMSLFLVSEFFIFKLFFFNCFVVDFFRSYRYDVTWRYMIFGFCFMMLALFFAVLMRAVRRQRAASQQQPVKSQV